MNGMGAGVAPDVRILDRPRLRLYRLFVYLAVSVMVFGTTEPPFAERFLLVAVYLAIGLGGVALHGFTAKGRGWERRVWPVASLLDVAAQGFLIHRLGGAISPLLLLFGIPILVWGILRGIPGGLSAAFGAAMADALLLTLVREQVGMTEKLTVLGFHIPALLLLGLFAGLLGRRIHQAETQHHATCLELEQAHLDAESIIAHLSSGLLCLDDRGSITRINSSATRLLEEFGCPRQGATIETVRAIPGLVELAARLEDRLGVRGEASWELVLGKACEPAAAPGEAITPDDARIPHGREIPVEVSTSPVLDSNGHPRGMVVFIQDMSGRLLRERERLRKERLALIGELSAGLAHEIRNSLKPITGSVELLRLELRAGDPTVDSLMEIILRESESLDGFLTEFLNFARDKNLQIKPAPIERVIGEEFESLSLIPGRPFRLTLPREGEVPLWVGVDPGAFRQVLRNLGLNALEAGGAPIEIGWERDGSEVVIHVRDHGPGIPDEIRDRVLDPFFTTKPHGTGLGLAVVRDLVERHGGRLSLDPAAGGGTRASVRLPLVEPLTGRDGDRRAADGVDHAA